MAAPAAIGSLQAVQQRTVLYQGNISLIDTTSIVDWWSYFFAETDVAATLLLTELPVSGSNDYVSVELLGGQNMKCGQIVLGIGSTIGIMSPNETGFEGLDFSHVETNIYGDLVTVERAATEIHRFDVVMETGAVSEYARFMKSLKGGKRALWVGDPDPAVRAWIYGFVRDHQIYYRDGTLARARITVQGVV